MNGVVTTKDKETAKRCKATGKAGKALEKYRYHEP
jgi:hypothetical protein